MFLNELQKNQPEILKSIVSNKNSQNDDENIENYLEKIKVTKSRFEKRRLAQEYKNQ